MISSVLSGRSRPRARGIPTVLRGPVLWWAGARIASESASSVVGADRPITLNAAASGVLPSFDIIFHALSDGSIFVGVSSLSSVKLCTEPASSSDDSSSDDPDRFGRELVEKTDSSSDSSDSTYVACAYRSLWVISLWVILFSFSFVL